MCFSIQVQIRTQNLFLFDKRREYGFQQSSTFVKIFNSKLNYLLKYHVRQQNISVSNFRHANNKFKYNF